jgi:hypothetical protein
VSRRRFLGRATAALGGAAGVWAAGGPAARAGAPDEGGRGRPPFDLYAPDLPAEPDADAAPAIQAAIDEAGEAGGGTVYVPAGRWAVGTPLVVGSHVAVRGASVVGTVLRSTADDDAVVVLADGVDGAAIEDLTVDGAGIGWAGAARFCIVRRVRVRDASGAGVAVASGAVEHVWLEQLTIEDAGGDGLVIQVPSSTSVFVSELAVSRFGAAVGDAAAVRLAARAHVSLVHVDPVGAGQVGVAFEDGSTGSTLTNYYLHLDGGEPTRTAPGVQVAVGPGAVE